MNGVILFGGESEEPMSGRIRWDMCLIDPADGEALHDPLVGALHGGGILLIERTFMLVDHNPIAPQRFEAVSVEFFCEKALAWPKGVGGVHDDQIVFILPGSDVFQSILNSYVDPLIIQAAGGLRQIFSADFQYQRVDLHQIDMIDRRVLSELSRSEERRVGKECRL